MGLFDALLGNASVVNNEEVKKELQLILAEEEEVEVAFRLVRDVIVFAKTRLILVGKQGVTGKKVEYHSIPFKKHFSLQY